MSYWSNVAYLIGVKTYFYVFNELIVRSCPTSEPSIHFALLSPTLLRYASSACLCFNRFSLPPSTAHVFTTSSALKQTSISPFMCPLIYKHMSVPCPYPYPFPLPVSPPSRKNHDQLHIHIHRSPSPSPPSSIHVDILSSIRMNLHKPETKSQNTSMERSFIALLSIITSLFCIFVFVLAFIVAVY